MSTDASKPDTIVLIHGFWVTPGAGRTGSLTTRAGLSRIAPAYPGFEVEVEALNADPTPIEQLTGPRSSSTSSRRRRARRAPIIMGHSAGGVFTQILLERLRRGRRRDQLSADRGGQAVPLSQLKATFPVLKNPANRHQAVGFTLSSGTTRSPTRSPRTSRRGCTSATTSPSGDIFWGSALANIHPGHDDTHVNYKNPDRAPLLFISGEQDHLMPPKIQQSNAKHYKAEGSSPRSRSSPGRTCFPPRRLGRGGRLR